LNDFIMNCDATHKLIFPKNNSNSPNLFIQYFVVEEIILLMENGQ